MLELKEVKNAQEELSRINKAQHNFNNNTDKILREIEKKYYNLKRKLEDKRNKEIDKEEKTKEEIN